jgi:hypothetical protein
MNVPINNGVTFAFRFATKCAGLSSFRVSGETCGSSNQQSGPYTGCAQYVAARPPARNPLLFVRILLT